MTSSVRKSESIAHTPSMRLDGRRAFVTGASRGIGLASAAALARSGAHVYMCARDRKAIEDVAGILLAEDAQVTPLQLDISDLDEVTNCIDRIGGLDILVNNAGMNRPQLMVDMSIADFDAVMGLNVRATYFLTQAVVKGMILAGKRGSIINMSSQMGHVGGPRRTVYCASKHALEGLTKAMAIELGSVGIRVNTICPTFIETPLTEADLKKPGVRDWILSKVKLGRLGRVEDIMGAVVFLASDAAAMITGSALMIDGGWTAG
jgi:NAD(P)-dependent dehydrogenase (short-subunit alcohol dehydrogenase family)